MGLNRREFISAASAGIGAHMVGAGCGFGQGSGQAVRPNILWLTVEDISANMGCYGDDYAITPNLDRLAKEGVLYENAFATSGVCAPARSCLITGVYPSTMGSQNMRCTGTLPEHIRCYSEIMRKAGYYCTNNSKTDYNFKHPESAWDESSKKAHWRNRRAGQPFFAIFNDTGTHESKIRSKEKEFSRLTAALKPEERHDPAKAPIPPYYPDTPAVRRDWARYSDLITGMDYRIQKQLDELEEAGLADDTIVFYYSDHGAGLPRAKRWLYDSGMHVPLIVRFGKNVKHLAPAKPGSRLDRLVSFVDFAATLLSLAGVKVPEYMHGKAFMGKQEAAERKYVYGIRDRMDERVDLIRAVRDKRYKYLRNYMSHQRYAQEIGYMNQMPTMKELRRLSAADKLEGAEKQFMALTKPNEELYDTQEDPHEVRNLADSPAHQKILKRLRKEHLRWARETKDLGLIPEPQHLELTEKYGSGWAILQQPENATLIDEILEVVEQLEKGAIEDMKQSLGHQRASVRYWAALGLGLQGKRAGSAAGALREALSDEAGLVRVGAGRALCRMGRRDGAIDVLIKELKDNENQATRHYAALALEELTGKSASVLAALKAATKDQYGYTKRVASSAASQS